MIDYFIFVSMYSLIKSVVTANFIAGLFSITFNYLAHYLWSFKSIVGHSNSALKYLANLIIFWTLNTLMLKALISSGTDAKIAKLIPMSLIAPLSFLSLKFIVFKKVKL